MLVQVQTETPGSAIFVMKYAARVRHIEVQVLADRHAQAISVFGRDCTLQVLHPIRALVYTCSCGRHASNSHRLTRLFSAEY